MEPGSSSTVLTGLTNPSPIPHPLFVFHYLQGGCMMSSTIQPERAPTLRFDGKGSDLFGIFLTNAALTLVTLGVYYFWAKVRVQKYLHQHTSFLGSRCDYHVTGKERFIGFLRALKYLGVLAIVLIIIFALVKLFYLLDLIHSL